MLKMLARTAATFCLIWADAEIARSHEFEALKISRTGRIGDGPYIEILLQDTTAGRGVVCALYLGGELVQSDTWITDNLATKVLINYEGSMDAVQCVYND